MNSQPIHYLLLKKEKESDHKMSVGAMAGIAFEK